MAWVVTIAGTDRSSLILRDTFGVSVRGAQREGVCQFVVSDPSGSLSIVHDQVVRVTDSGTEVFEGPIRALRKHDLGTKGPRRYEVTAKDYTCLLDDDVIDVASRSTSESDQARVIWLVGTYGNKGVTAQATPTGHVAQLLANMPVGDDGIPRQDFGGKTLREALNQVAALAGAYLYVDGDLELHWFAGLVGDAAPFGLSDAPNGSTTFGYHDLDLPEDYVEFVDEVLVRGTGVQDWVNRGSPPPLSTRRRAVLDDPDVTSAAQIAAAGAAFLAAHNIQQDGALVTTKAGLLPNMVVQITNALWGLSAAQYRVQEVGMKLLGRTSAEYTVRFGSLPVSLSALVGSQQGALERTQGRLVDIQTNTPSIADLSVAGANLVPNSSMESGSDGSWEVGSRWTFGFTPTGDELAFHGAAVARALLTGTDAADLTLAKPILVDHTDDYHLSFWSFLRARSAGRAEAWAIEQAADGTVLASTKFADIGAVEAAWTRHSLHLGPNSQKGRTPFQSTTTKVTLAFRTTGSANMTWDVDGVQVERGLIITAYAPSPQELVDAQIGPTQIADDAITTPKIAAGAVVAGQLAAGSVTAVNIAASGISANSLLGGALVIQHTNDDSQVDYITVLNDDGVEIARLSNNGLALTDPNNSLLRLRLKDGVLEFSEDGGTQWTTAISALGISADAITLGTAPGGHNAVPNASMELAAFQTPLSKVWTVAADWGTTIGTDVNVTKSGDALVLTTYTFT